ncbi:DUF481 domain-containing protein [Pseudomonas oryzae]|uniref:Salt-induced outer membrane protein YdiY n=1 Tax=Pseudomonas oryzae TaxID=1392877 RepID=A0A1H1LHW2_9PSED|nr:DUF481 domain-containing protein [Pseudomonas oryzae]SDR74118.1 Protein of unknown function, DUF481 [Pseudomonas oryzae]
MRPLSLLLLVCLSLTTVPALADTVWLNNGDRLTGRIQLFDGDRLLFETDYAGSVSLDWKQVASLESEQALLVRLDDGAGEHARGLRRAADGRVELVDGAARNVALARIRQILPPRSLVEDWVWSGSADFAFEYEQADKDVEEFDVDLRTKARHGQWRHNLSASYDRESKDGAETEDSAAAEYALDRFLGEHWFWQGKFEYERDRIGELRIQRTLGSGPGYQFWDNELGAFSVVSLLNRHDLDFATGGDERLYALGFKWDYNRFLFGKRFELFSHGELGVPFIDAIDYKLESDLGLRYRITSWASLHLKGEWDQLRGEQGAIDESTYSVGFGVGW